MHVNRRPNFNILLAYVLSLTTIVQPTNQQKRKH